MHKDIIVVGAGISGIAAGYNLQKSCPNKSFAILEGRDSLGGTWDLFKYPGIRSDSDMHTLGFRFKPWIHKKSIADGPSILDYLNETVDEYDLRKKILFNQKVIAFVGGGHYGRFFNPEGDTNTKIVISDDKSCFLCRWQCHKLEDSSTLSYPCMSSINYTNALNSFIKEI